MLNVVNADSQRNSSTLHFIALQTCHILKYVWRVMEVIQEKFVSFYRKNWQSYINNKKNSSSSSSVCTDTCLVTIPITFTHRSTLIMQSRKIFIELCQLDCVRRVVVQLNSRWICSKKKVGLRIIYGNTGGWLTIFIEGI